MANEKKINSRIVHKHDIEANWLKAVNFIPYLGELIIYDIDDNYSYPRFKVGDGETNVNKLPFTSAPADWNQNDSNASDYIRNRTHWIEEEYEEIITLENQPGYSYSVKVENWAPVEPLLIDDNEEYIIIVDGQTYTCTSYFDPLAAATILGNSTIVNPDTTSRYNVPFCVEHYIMEEEAWISRYGIYCNHEDGQTNHTFTIKQKTGNTVYHQLDEKFIPDAIARTAHIHNNYGVCSTAAGTAAKTVEIEGFELREGAVVHVKFTNANSASNPTLNVSGTGAKPMYRYGTTALSTGTTTTGWYAGCIQVFVYDGTGWVRDYWNNSTYSNAGLGQGYGLCETAAATVAKTATMSSYTLSTGGIVAIKFTNDVCANATLNIASKGAKAIYYQGEPIADGVIKAGDTATFIYSTQYHLIALDKTTAEVTAITNAEIDEIVNSSIKYAEDVMF